MDSLNWTVFLLINVYSLIGLSYSYEQFYWSSAGPISGKVCVQWLEASDPHTWEDNYLCSEQDWGLKWNSAGPIDGMKCTQILEASDPHTWNDNYFCAPNDSPLTFSWSSAGNNCGGHGSVHILEASDPHTWNDNYLCWTFNTPQFYWSSAGAIPNKVCVQWLETVDPHTWDDNYLCSDNDWGLKWSGAGTINGMKCTQILEAADPSTWDDNYLCVPNNSPLTFKWSSAGNNCGGDRSVQILETADPNTWDDNYLCWTFTAGISSIGCYTDSSNRALRYWPSGSNSYSIESCADTCGGYTYFSLQNYNGDGGQCFCENDLSHATKYGSSNGCNSNGLGGSWANNIYSRSQGASVVILLSPYLSYISYAFMALCVFTFMNLMVCISYSCKANRSKKGYDKVVKDDPECIDSDVEN